MKNGNINLHLGKKRAYSIMLSFTLLFTLINLAATISINSDYSQLSSLFRSSYWYSANVMSATFQDDYYQFDAGISFLLAPGAESSLNAEVLMQSVDSRYTEAVDWNTEKLDSSSVALSEGLAKTYNLKIGDKIYSINYLKLL